VMVCMVFGVLFGFRRSDFRSSDHFPKIPLTISNEEKSGRGQTVEKWELAVR
jgi:hypothetical protein